MENKISLTAARVNAGYTQAAAAGLLGIAPETLRAYESGKRSPNWTTLRKMEALYKWPVDGLRQEDN